MDEDDGDVLTIAYQSGYYDGKKAAKRTWVGLTDEDIALIDWESLVFKKDCVRVIEAKLKEKNT